MGKAGLPWYPEELANAIEANEKIVAKIKSNKYDEKDLQELAEINAEIIKYATTNKD